MKKIIKLFNALPSNIKITLSYVFSTAVSAILFYPLIPLLLNYPPDSMNNDFQIEVNNMHYSLQFSITATILCVFLLAILPIVFRKLRNVDKVFKDGNVTDKDKLIETIKSCMNYPIIIFFIELVITPVIIFIFLVLIKNEMILSIKITMILFSMVILVGLISYSFSRALFRNILHKLSVTDKLYGIRFKISYRLILQLVPLFVFTIIIFYLITYSQLSKSTGNFLFKLYQQELSYKFNKPVTSLSEAIENLKSIPLNSDSDEYFIVSSTENTILSKTNLSDFFVKYMFAFSEKHKGHTYDYYGNPVEGSYITLNIDGEDYFVGIRYSTFISDFSSTILPLVILISTIDLCFILYIANIFRSEIKLVAMKLLDISKYSTNNIHSKLPVLSNDEIADLTIAFNSIQDLTAQHIQQIRDNQDILVEKERLASLGQMIGGIAHNLKTPILSIAGTSEALIDLIKEYNNSIEDPNVNFQDHHEIAKEMLEWVEKAKSYTGYMSDVITAVKGQAVALSQEDINTFTVEEIVKTVDILMKHELQSALINLNIILNVDKDLSYKGNINSLVQVINNMISNAIQAYSGSPNQKIDLIIDAENNKLIISIKDYGPGLPDRVKDKLFKEMVTTKGKNGTGLGLFMSYSNIRAHFNGTITVESEEGKGTTFHIILPINP